MQHVLYLAVPSLPPSPLSFPLSFPPSLPPSPSIGPGGTFPGLPEAVQSPWQAGTVDLSNREEEGEREGGGGGGGGHRSELTVVHRGGR